MSGATQALLTHGLLFHKHRRCPTRGDGVDSIFIKWVDRGLSLHQSICHLLVRTKRNFLFEPFGGKIHFIARLQRG